MTSIVVLKLLSHFPKNTHIMSLFVVFTNYLLTPLVCVFHLLFSFVPSLSITSIVGLFSLKSWVIIMKYHYDLILTCNNNLWLALVSHRVEGEIHIKGYLVTKCSKQIVFIIGFNSKVIN